MADPHFDHYMSIKYCKRPFKTDKEMTSAMIANINKVVKQNDILFIIGDFGLGSVKQLAEIRHRIKCYNVNLIVGNHDHKYIKNTLFKKMFSRIYEQVEIKVGNYVLFLNHYSMRVWSKSHYGSIQLHGHSHGNLWPKRNSLDCGVDLHNFVPLNLKQILEELNKPYKRIWFYFKRLLNRYVERIAQKLSNQTPNRQR